MSPWLVTGFLAGLVGMALVTDLKEMRIPNKLTLGGAISGLLLHLALNGWLGLWHSAIGLAAGFILVFIMYLIHAVGAGDVKLFAAIGAIAGPDLMMSSLIYAILYAGMIGLLLYLLRKSWWANLRCHVMAIISILIFRDLRMARKELSRSDIHAFPFMLAVFPGVATALIYTFLL